MSTQPYILIEDEPLLCLCGTAGPIVWEVTHVNGPSTCHCNACSDCWTNWMRAQAEKIKSPDYVNCICNRATVAMSTVQSILTADDFEKLCERLSLLAARRLPDWVACPKGECSYGDIHNPQTDGPMWQCRRLGCETKACASCHTPWHEGETCEQFLERTAAEFCDIRVSEREKDDIPVKSCWYCNNGLYKTDGCDHMTCRCGYEFCWVCGSCYLRAEEDDSILLTQHEVSCVHFDGDRGYEITGAVLLELAAVRKKICFSSRHSAIRVSIDFRGYPREGIEVVTREVFGLTQ